MTTNPRIRVRHDLSSVAASGSVRGPRRAGARSHQKAMLRAYGPDRQPGTDSRWRSQRGYRADPPAACAVEGCDRTDHYARGLCSKHYQSWSRYGHEHIGLPFCPPLRERSARWTRPRPRPPAPPFSEIVAEMRAAYRVFVEEVGA